MSGTSGRLDAFVVVSGHQLVASGSLFTGGLYTIVFHLGSSDPRWI